MKMPQSFRFRRRVLKLLLASLTTFCALGAAEIALRVVFPLGSQIYTFDGEAHYRYRPDSRKLMLRPAADGGGLIEVQINEGGFRGEDFSQEKAAGEKRLVVYGDSFIAGEYSNLDATFCRQLESELQAGNPNWRVINAGVSGYGLDQVLLKMEREIGDLSVDSVLLSICCENDTIDLMVNKIFRIESGELVSASPVLEAKQKTYLDPPFGHPRRYHLGKLIVRAMRNFRHGGDQPSPQGETSDAEPATAVCEEFLLRCDQHYTELVIDRDPVVRDIFEGFYDVDLALHPHNESSQFKRQASLEILRRIQSLLAARDIELRVMLIPSIRDAVPELDDEFGRGLRELPGHDPARLTAWYEELTDTLGVASLNLYPPFVEKDAAGLFFRSHDPHWNDEGQAFAAKLAAVFLRAGEGEKPRQEPTTVTASQ